MKRIVIKLIAAVSLVMATQAAVAQTQVATLRGTTDLAENADPHAIPKVENTDLRQMRNYPEQPPLIPHRIDGYQIDANANQCLQCHARAATGVSQAPMV